VDLRILTLPEGLDPCDFLLEQGAEPFVQLLDGAVDALQHKIRVATAGIDLIADTHAANRALEEILGTLAKTPRLQVGAGSETALREQQLLTQLARRFGVPENELRSRLRDLRRRPQRPTPRAETESLPLAPLRVQDLDPREIELLEILVMHPELAGDAIRDIAHGPLKSPPAREIFDMIQRLHEAGLVPEFGRVLTELDDPRLKNILVEIDERAHAKAAEALLNSVARLHTLASSFRAELTNQNRRHQLAALQEGRLDEEQELEALKLLVAQQRASHAPIVNEQGTSAPMDGQDA
jgi:DNA primase